MATVNQMIPLSGDPKRFSLHMETNEKTTQVRPRNTISHRLKAIIVSWGCTRFGLVALFGLGRPSQAEALAVQSRNGHNKILEQSYVGIWDNS
jgi:hypothetical protein